MGSGLVIWAARERREVSGKDTATTRLALAYWGSVSARVRYRLTGPGDTLQVPGAP